MKTKCKFTAGIEDWLDLADMFHPLTSPSNRSIKKLSLQYHHFSRVFLQWSLNWDEFLLVFLQ